MTAAINAHDVSAASLKLLDEHVLVRAAPAQEILASGLYVPNAARETFGRGSEFYGVVVAVGPGRLVERGPSREKIAAFIHRAVLERFQHDTGPRDLAEMVAADVGIDIIENTTHERVPMPWKPGDHVMARQGFGPEIELREGRHHIVGRGNAEHGHGIIAAWDPRHVHCWHIRPDKPITDDGYAFSECACGAVGGAPTRLPACVSCPPGPRAAEAVLGGEVYRYAVGRDTPAGDYEMRPEDDGRETL